MRYRFDFNAIDWASPAPGVRHKVLDQAGRRLRLVEYDREMPPHWCTRGHTGLILDGTLEIEFEDATVIFSAGDGVHIPGGEAHRHRARVISATAAAVFVEEMP